MTTEERVAKAIGAMAQALYDCDGESRLVTRIKAIAAELREGGDEKQDFGECHRCGREFDEQSWWMRSGSSGLKSCNPSCERPGQAEKPASEPIEAGQVWTHKSTGAERKIRAMTHDGSRLQVNHIENATEWDVETFTRAHHPPGWES